MAWLQKPSATCRRSCRSKELTLLAAATAASSSANSLVLASSGSQAASTIQQHQHSKSLSTVLSVGHATRNQVFRKILCSTILVAPGLTISCSPASGVHVVELSFVYCLVTVLINPLLVRVLGWPVLGQLFTFKLEACYAVPEVVYASQLADGVLDRCLCSSLEQELVLLRVLQSTASGSGLLFNGHYITRLNKGAIYLEVQQHHGFCCGAKEVIGCCSARLAHC